MIVSQLLVITPIPAFYKVNLYNKISERKKVFVIFISDETSEKRGEGFTALQNANFEYAVLDSGLYEFRNKLRSLRELRRILSSSSFDEILVSGWDAIEYWYLAFSHRKSKISLALESTVFESQISGVRGLVKKIFLSRVRKVFASGSKHKGLVESLGYRGDVVVTKGVGIIRKSDYPISKDGKVNNRVVFVGRLSPEKNLSQIVEVFNRFPHICLDIYGDGPQRESLEKISCGNISFKGFASNSSLSEIFRLSDFLVLPSASEPWGLVVEEALFHGVPVVISDRCGVSDLVENGKNGYVVPFEKLSSSLENLLKDYQFNVLRLDGHLSNRKKLNDKDKVQVDAYI